MTMRSSCLDPAAGREVQPLARQSGGERSVATSASACAALDAWVRWHARAVWASVVPKPLASVLEAWAVHVQVAPVPPVVRQDVPVVDETRRTSMFNPDQIIVSGSGRRSGGLGPRRTAAQATQVGRRAARGVFGRAPARGRARTAESTAGARIARRAGGTVTRTGTIRERRSPGRPRRG